MTTQSMPPLGDADGAGDGSHWADMTESTFVTGMLLLFAVYRHLGRWPFRACLYPVVGYYWLTRKTARAASLQYLRRHHTYHKLAGPLPGVWDSLRHFLAFAEVILDKLLAYSGRYHIEGVQVSGHEPLLESMAAGQGAVVMTSHTGCVELCQVMAQQYRGLKLTILVHTRHAQRFNRLIKRLSGESGIHILQVTEFNAGTAMMMAERVQRGELLAIAGDRVPVTGGRMCAAEFLGHEARFPLGPYVLAAVLKCPLYFLGCVRHGDSYRIDIKELAAQVVLPKRKREEALCSYARQYAQELEALLEKSPTSWFNFFPFWDQGRTPATAPESGKVTHGS